jgi:hypothetical protein
LPFPISFSYELKKKKSYENSPEVTWKLQSHNFPVEKGVVTPMPIQKALMIVSVCFSAHGR